MSELSDGAATVGLGVAAESAPVPAAAGPVAFQALLTQHVVGLLRPLTAAVDPVARQRLFNAIGWDLSAVAGIQPAVLDQALNSCSGALQFISGRLANGLDDLAEAVACLIRGADAVQAVSAALRGRRQDGTMPPPSPVLENLAEDILYFLLDAHLSSALPRLQTTLDVLRVRRIEHVAEIRVGGAIARTAGDRPRFHPEALGELLQDPVTVLRQRIFGLDPAASPDDPVTIPADPDGIAQVVGPLLADWLSGLGLPISYGTPGASQDDSLTTGEQLAAAHLLHLDLVGYADSGTAAGAHIAMGLTRDPPEGPLAGVVVPEGAAKLHGESGPWGVTLEIVGHTGPIAVTAHGARFLTTTLASVTATVEAAYGQAAAGRPALRLGTPGSTRLEVDKVTATLTGLASVREVDHQQVTEATFKFAFRLGGSRLVIQAGTDSGFLSMVLPNQPIIVNLDLGLAYSPATGLTVSGSARLDKTFAVGLVLGPLTVLQARVALQADPQQSIECLLTADFRVRLGPVTATAAGLGLRAALVPAPTGGALGPFDVDLAFRPPRGVGIAVDSGVVKGGGYLYGDEASGQYVGVVQLAFAGVQLSAIGLLSTRLPGGQRGFSLLVLISFTFPPVQLGFGFALTGVGGLIGVHRSVDLPALRGGLAQGALDSVLFPPDLVSNAPRVVADLSRFFPVTIGQYVVGPTVQLTWGSPPVLTATLGIFIEFPSPTRVLVAGRLRLVLPTSSEQAVVSVQVDLLGVLDLARSRLELDGVLRESHLGPYALSGQMAVRAGWGAAPAFLAAVGGFNPRFQAPAGFPALDRITLSLGQGDNPRLRLAAYLALTSNTVQFGARLDLYAAASLAGLGTFALAGVFGFDALVQLDPFGFVVDLDLTVVIMWGSGSAAEPLFAVRLYGALSGPSPWNVSGQAAFELFGQKLAIPIRLTVGAALPPPSPASRPLEAEVREALRMPDSWMAQPPSASPIVSLAESAGRGAGIVVHPFGSLTVKQRVAPLERDLDHYGSDLIDGPRRFTITSLSVGTVGGVKENVTDYFAPAHYLHMSDTDRLTAPSFESWVAGVKVTEIPPKVPTSGPRNVPAQATLVTIGRSGVAPTAAEGFAAAAVVQESMPDDRMLLHALGGAAAVNGAAAQGARAYEGPSLGMGVREPRYAVVTARRTAGGLFELTEAERYVASFAKAAELLRTTAAQQPARVPALRVVENAEVFV